MCGSYALLVISHLGCILFLSLSLPWLHFTLNTKHVTLTLTHTFLSFTSNTKKSDSTFFHFSSTFAMASMTGFLGSPVGAITSVTRHHMFGVRAQSLDSASSTVLSSESDSVTAVNGASVVLGTQRNGALVKEEKKVRLLSVEEKKNKEGLAALWDDGYGTRTVEDYFVAAKEMCKSDGGPARWFCPIECGPPLMDSPTLLFLPGKHFTSIS